MVVTLAPPKQSHLKLQDIYEMFTSLFLTISKGQLIMDSIKQVLTTFQLFHPLTLFKYLSKGSPVLTIRNFEHFLEQNNISFHHWELAKILQLQCGIVPNSKASPIQYTTFLNMIYPYNSPTLREIASNQIKFYHELENLQVTEDVLACFLLLMTEKLKLFQKIEVQKNDTIGRLSKGQLEKVVKSIKRLTVGEKVSNQHCEHNFEVITNGELINFVNMFTREKDFHTNTLVYLFRKLNGGNSEQGYVKVSKLMAFLKPWRKSQQQYSKDNKENSIGHLNYFEDAKNEQGFDEGNGNGNSFVKKQRNRCTSMYLRANNSRRGDYVQEEDEETMLQNQKPQRRLSAEKFNERDYKYQLYNELSQTMNPSMNTYFATDLRKAQNPVKSPKVLTNSQGNQSNSQRKSLNGKLMNKAVKVKSGYKGSTNPKPNLKGTPNSKTSKVNDKSPSQNKKQQNSEIYSTSSNKRQSNQKQTHPQSQSHQNGNQHKRSSTNGSSYRPNGVNVQLFIRWLQTFIKNKNEIETLKEKLSNVMGTSGHIGSFGNTGGNSAPSTPILLKVFKSIDKEERGVIVLKQLKQFYERIGGQSVSISFDVLITAFSQTGETWLSYRQFSDIFNPSIEKSFSNQNLPEEQPSTQHHPLTKPRQQHSHYHSQHQQNRLMSQIMYLTLVNEYELLQIRREFQRGEIVHLFSLINKEGSGFVNYQELKKFLLEIGQNLTMYELMLVLKKLDKSRNGVVTESQFVSYFLIAM